MTPSLLRALLASTSVAFAVGSMAGAAGCAASSSRQGFEEPTKDPNAPAPAPTGDFNKNTPPPTDNPGEVKEVFGHSETALFRLDPTTNAIMEVGPFDGCGSVIDIALDEASTLYAVSYEALFTVDKTNAKCTKVASGTYPNSLSFVPKGTVDPDKEALVGYEDANYVRIDTTTGNKTSIGTLGGGFVSSGDIVSVKGGNTYLTVKGGSCSTKDCLVEVNPTNGKLVKNWGSIEHKDVFGLSFWGGKVYGFTEAGDLFEVTFGTSQLATKTIPMASKPSGLSFWGAGSSTSAPLVSTPQ